MSKLKPGAGRKAKFTSYAMKGNFSKNAKRKLAKHLKAHPNDQQAVTALAGVASRKIRTKPVAKLGWVKESLRAAMAFVPYLNSKGQVIVIKSVEHFSQVANTYSQPIPVTRSAAKAYARIKKKKKVAPFRKVATFVHKGGEVALEYVHDSKLNNFTGKCKKKKAVDD